MTVVEKPTTTSMGQSKLAELPVRPRAPWYAEITRYKGVIIGGIVFLLMLLIATFAGVITTYKPNYMNPANRLSPPSPEHFFGTDNFGRDIFSLTVYGTRVSLLVGLSVSALTVLGGAVFGLIAGYFPKLDTPVMRIMDALMAFPDIVLGVGIMAILGPQITNVIFVLTVVITPRLVRLVRSVVLTIRHTPYIEAARSIGASEKRILLRHVLPNCMAPLIIQATFIFGAAVLAEASLSFLGLGVPPDVPTWGSILGEGRMFIRQASYILVFPGVALAVTVLALNLIGDGLRDWLDPRLRHI